MQEYRDESKQLYDNKDMHIKGMTWFVLKRLCFATCCSSVLLSCRRHTVSQLSTKKIYYTLWYSLYKWLLKQSHYINNHLTVMNEYPGNV